MKKVWINGCFDILHRGHKIELLSLPKRMELSRGRDRSRLARVKQLKGSSRPINNQKDRKFFLESIKYVDEVIIFESENQLIEEISILKPDLMIVGSDYINKRVIGSEKAKKLMFFDRVGDYSTTKILEEKK